MKKIGLGLLVSLIVLVTIYIVTPTATLFDLVVGVERKMSGLTLKHVSVDDLDIEYLRGGTGEPLVLLHGFGADKDNWNRIAKYLVDDFDVISIDLPGFGNSTRDINLNYGVHSQVIRLRKILAELGVKQFNLAGSSMGGYIAANFASQYPEKVKSLWLISPFGVASAEASEMFRNVKQGASPVVLPTTEAEFLTLLDFLFVEPPFIPAPIVNYLATQAEARAELNSKIYQQIHRMKGGVAHPESPLESVLAGYQGKTLVSWGEQDRILHVSGAHILKQKQPSIRLDIIQQMGHLPMVEQAKVSADTFLKFVIENR